MKEMNITSAQYIGTSGDLVIKANVDGIDTFVPIDLDNTLYAEIMRQVDAGELTIQEAE